MIPETPLPYDTDVYSNEAIYVDSLLEFISTHELLRTLCGGVHVLDFFTREPDLYSQILPSEWREFFDQHDMMDLLDLFMREDLQIAAQTATWQNGPVAPTSLLNYIADIRKHSLKREPQGSHCARNRTQKQVARHVSIGMNVKKVHEVGIFACYIDSLARDISESMREDEQITHLIDFGSGQSYLGRALASEPYNRNIVAIESKTRNAERAKVYDARAKIAERERLIRNKKAFRSGLVPADRPSVPEDLPTPPKESNEIQHGNRLPAHGRDMPDEARGRIQHIEHRIQSGDLTDVISNVPSLRSENGDKVMVMSLHSCGNLVHHGLRSLILNPSVKSVAMVGCCYNLLTERRGPATYKHPDLRPTTHAHPRVERLGEACDPDGFPMSDRFCTYKATGIRLNITARMMAVQAPANWGEKDSDSFFTRHFYRALLQRIFLDRGVVSPPSDENAAGVSPSGHSSGGTPILIGHMSKSCYVSFVEYVRGALAKLYEDPILGDLDEAEDERYHGRRDHLV